MLQRAVAHENVIVTANGKPFVLELGLSDEEDPVELERWVRQARAQRVVSRTRERALGTDSRGEGKGMLMQLGYAYGL